MRYQVKAIGLWAFVRVAFILNMVLGFIGGIFYAAIMAFVMAVGSAFSPDELGGFPGDGFEIGPLLLIFIPFMFAIGGAVVYTMMGIVAVLVYNLAARLVGGLEFTVEEVPESTSTQDQKSPPPAPPRPTSPLPPPPLPDQPRLGRDN